MSTIPKILVSDNGEEVNNVKKWRECRRLELLDLFAEKVYGKAPVQRPKTMKFDMKKACEVMQGKAVLKLVEVSYEGLRGKGYIHVAIFIPKAATKPVPAFLLINNRDVANIDPAVTDNPFWPVEQIVNRGYAAAAFSVEDVDPDYDDEFKNGVHGIFNNTDIPRGDDAWGTISAWAWGASRVMDYMENDMNIDKDKIALVGHSRGGKTSLWCGAQDERFAMVVGNNSGCTGAALSRGKKGESIELINEAFNHWFCKNYKKYNGREEDLPIDQHMLLSLIAPRLLYVTSASEDLWSDPEAEFLSCTLAEDAYKLYGSKGLGIKILPEFNAPVFGDRMAYHIRKGKHDLTTYDWTCFMDFADKYFMN